jgi:hypothetical protein
MCAWEGKLQCQCSCDVKVLAAGHSVAVAYLGIIFATYCQCQSQAGGRF